MAQYHRDLESNERVVPVALPNGKPAFIMFRQNDDGNWISTATNEMMEDLQVSIHHQ